MKRYSLHKGATDLRKSIDGLATVVKEEFEI
ncbi:transposase [Bacillus nitratireducens]|nr:transposase [Bacillus nitratireducens]